jgi:hypothetical protein
LASSALLSTSQVGRERWASEEQAVVGHTVFALIGDYLKVAGNLEKIVRITVSDGHATFITESGARILDTTIAQADVILPIVAEASKRR